MLKVSRKLLLLKDLLSGFRVLGFWGFISFQSSQSDCCLYDDADIYGLMWQIER